MGLGASILFFIVLGFALMISLYVWNSIQWRAIPTIQEYLAANPHCRTHRGIKCVACNSGSIKNWGVSSANDKKRNFVCNHCGVTLYRSS